MDFSKDFHFLFELIDGYLKKNHSEEPVHEALTTQQLGKLLDLHLPLRGKPLKALESDVEQYFQYATKTAHPHYFNQLWGGVEPAALLGELVTAVANTSMYTQEVAPVATLIEKTLVAKMASLAGFKDAEGQFTTGGSNGNLMAMVMARHKKLADVKKSGLFGQQRLAVFVSEEAHYSIDKAAHILGLGENAVWKVKVDDQGKMDPVALMSSVQAAKAKGEIPMMLIGTAGTTVRGAFDPILELVKVAHQEEMWMHVDGAWGGAVLLSSKHRYLLNGVENADSLVWDAHKMMGMPLMCSVLIVREKRRMLETFSTSDTEYLFHGEELDDLGPSTIHCGRRADALKLWFAWRRLGDKGWEELIDGYMDLAAYAENTLRHHERLKLVCSREFTNVCFQVLPKDSAIDVNDFQVLLRKKLLERKMFMVNYATLQGQKVIRLVMCNNQTSQQDVDAFFQEVLEVANVLDS